jgi:hypothetical protein
MEDSLIAAILTLLIILILKRSEEYTDHSFNSQIADLNVLNKHEALLHFKDSDFNQTDSKLDPGGSLPLKK